MRITKYTIMNFIAYEILALATIFILDIDTLIGVGLLIIPLPIFWLIDRYWPKKPSPA